MTARALALLLVLLSACAAEPGAGRTTGVRRERRAAPPVEVRAVAFLEGAPLSGTRLRFASADGVREVVTGADGRFVVALAGGLHEVTAPDQPRAEVTTAQAWWVEREVLLRGTVMSDDGDDARLPGALVWVWRESDALDFDAVPDGATELHEGDEGQLVVRFLSPWTLGGTVVDALTGAPIAGAKVTTDPEREDVWATATDAAGRFELAVPSWDRHRELPVLFSAPGRGTVATTFCAAGEDAPGGEPLRVPLRPALTLQGRVVDLRGAPVAATLTVDAALPDVRTGGVVAGPAREVACDAGGWFRIAGLAPGTGDRGPNAASVVLHAGHADHARALEEAVVWSGAAPVEVRLDRLLPARGRVVGPDGAPVAGVDLIPGECDEHLTDGEGRFDLGRLPERSRFEVGTERFGRQMIDAWLPVSDLVLRLEDPAVAVRGEWAPPFALQRPGEVGRAFLQAFDLTPPPPVDRSAHGRVSFRIQAAAEATLAVFHHAPDGSRSQSFYSHGEIRGSFEVGSWQPPGRHAVEVRARGHAPAVRWYEVRAGEDRVEPPLQLWPGGGALAVNARWPDAPVRGLVLRFRDPVTGFEVEEWADAPSLPDVPCRFEPIGEGRVTVHLAWVDEHRERHPLPPVEVVLRDGETTTTDVDLRR